MGEVAVNLLQVHKSFGSVQALQDVSFVVEPGEAVVLLGPNGAGKSTVVALLLGLRAPSRGLVQVLGADPRDAATRARIGAMLQETALPPGFTVSELLAFYRSLHRSPLSQQDAAARAGVGDLLGARVERLSGGQRRRVVLALALCGDPDILFLDEPTTGMDTQARGDFWRQMDAFARSGRTLLFTTHYLEEADRHARRILVLQKGRLVADASPESLRGSGASRSLGFKAPAEWLPRVQELVPGAEVSDGTVRIETADAEGTLRILLQAGVPLADLEVTTRSLEAALAELSEGVDRA